MTEIHFDRRQYNGKMGMAKAISSDKREEWVRVRKKRKSRHQRRQ